MLLFKAFVTSFCALKNKGTCSRGCKEKKCVKDYLLPFPSLHCKEKSEINHKIVKYTNFFSNLNDQTCKISPSIYIFSIKSQRNYCNSA